MRTLSDTLSAAQKQASHIPYIRLEAVNKSNGITRLDWERLYTGIEGDYFHALTIPGDGSLIRARITPLADSRKLYIQRVINPGEGSDFSRWSYTGKYNTVIVATASLGAEVSVFWIQSDRKIQRIISADYGASWSSPQLIDYSPTTAINGIAAAYKSNGDLALFFADQSTLYVKKLINGQWQTKSAWDKITGNLSGVAVVYENDWNLFVTGEDYGGNFRLWSLIYGDGGDVPAGSWGELKTFAEAPSDGNYIYKCASLDKIDVFRCFYIEKYSGSEAYSRPFRSHTIAGTDFPGNLWREPQPFNLSSEYGLAIAHHGDYCWLSGASGVWRASLTEYTLDLTADILSLKQETGGLDGKLTVELTNDNAKFALLPAPLGIGCRINFGTGYTTSQGNEVSNGHSFTLEAYEYTSSCGTSKLIIHAVNCWDNIKRWIAKQQFRWNKDSKDTGVKEILAFILARAGLRLEVISESEIITGVYPDFSINPGISGDSIIKKLLSYVPDLLFIEGDTAYLVNPLVNDAPVYSYAMPQKAAVHPVLDASYRTGISYYNHIQVEGYDIDNLQPIITHSFDWEEIKNISERYYRIEDTNIDSIIPGQARGESILRKYDMESANGYIKIPVNCGQQVYDLIEINDNRAGLNAQKRRVIGFNLLYNPSRGQYMQNLIFGMP